MSRPKKYKYNKNTSNKSILYIKKSKSKTNKHKKRGNIGKDCIYYNHDKLSCDCSLSPYNHTLCKMCDYFKTNNSNNKDNIIFENKVYITKPEQAGIHDLYKERLSKNIGTPVHTEYLLKNKFDKRRHKARCIYYNKNDKLCYCGKSNVYMLKCNTSTHCIYYNYNY